MATGGLAGGGGTASSGPTGECTSSPIKFHVLDAEYSSQLERIVLVASAPSELVLLNPITLEAQEVALPLAANAVSISLDGMTAAVAHNAHVSIVDLGSATLTKTISTTCDANDIVLASNGFAYVFPQTDQWVDIHSVEIAPGVDRGMSQQWSIYAGSKAKLHPTSANMYGIDPAVSPTDIARYDISAGVARVANDSPYHGDYPICLDLWMSKDGQRIFTGCGTVFRAAPGTPDDMTYNGALGAANAAAAGQFRAIAHDEVRAKVYAIPRTSSLYPYDNTTGTEETQLRIYSYNYLMLETSITLPCMQAGANKATTYGRFVFPSSKGDAIYVLVQADPKAAALNDWGLAKL
jgi:hypothetical protein